MQNSVKYSALALCLGLLSACGGGGGGGGSSAQDSTQINQTSPLPSIEYVREDLKADVKYAKQIDIVNPVTRHIYKTINFYDYPKGLITETVAGRDNFATTYLKGLNLAYSASIVGYKDDSGEVGYMAHILGLPTKQENLPTGLATYRGKSVGRNSSGDLLLTADFAAKNVTGGISNHKRDSDGRTLSDISLQNAPMYTGRFYAKDGSSAPVTMFRGQAVSGNDRGYYTGAFTGPNAEEVVGTVSEYYNGDNTYQIFAGEKQ